MDLDEEEMSYLEAIQQKRKASRNHFLKTLKINKKQRKRDRFEEKMKKIEKKQFKDNAQPIHMKFDEMEENDDHHREINIDIKYSTFTSKRSLEDDSERLPHVKLTKVEQENQKEENDSNK